MWQSLECLWTRTDEEAALRTLSGAVCLCPLVNTPTPTWCISTAVSSTASHADSVSLLQPTESPTCLSPTSTLWTSSRFRDTLLWGETFCTKFEQCKILCVTSLSIPPVLQCWLTWTSPTLATWAQPSPPGPFTWPPPTRTSCGSSAVREVWSESLESYRGPAPAEGQLPSTTKHNKRKKKYRTEIIVCRWIKST